MNQEQSNDKWKGALFEKFEEEVISVPEYLYPKIESKIFPKSQRRVGLIVSFIVLFFSVLIILISEYSSSSPEKTNNSKFNFKSEKSDKRKRMNNKPNESKINSIAESPLKTKDSTSNDSKKNLLKTSGNFQEKRLAGGDLTKTESSLYFTSGNAVFGQKLGKDQPKDLSFDNVENNSTGSFYFSDSVRSKWDKLQLVLLSPWIIARNKSQFIFSSKLSKSSTKSSLFMSFDVNRGIQIRRIGGEIEAENLKSRTIGARRIPSRLTHYQFVIGKKQTKNWSLLGGVGIGFSDFQSRWFYRQLYKAEQEQPLKFTTFEGEARLQSNEIDEELSDGDTVLYRLRANYKSSFLSLPIGFVYTFSEKRFSPFLRYLISFDFHSKGDLSLDIQGQNFEKRYQLDFENNKFSFGLQQQVGLGMNIAITNNWSLFSEARLSLPLTRRRITNENNLRTSFLTIGFGMSYKF